MPTGPLPAHLHRRGDSSWQKRAACQPADGQPPEDPELFFPEPDEMDRIRAAKATCGECPVRRTCLDAALENRLHHGIWGGYTESERAELYKKLPLRLDRSRVQATLDGHDVHLTKAERDTVIRQAFKAGLSTAGLAAVLRITPKHASRLYREVRRGQRDHNATPRKRGRHRKAGDSPTPTPAPSPTDTAPEKEAA